MRLQIKDVLAKLKIDFGTNIFEEPIRFRGALADTYIKYDEKKVRFLLTLAFCEMNAYARLKTSGKDNYFASQILIEEMTKEYEINKIAAKVIIDCIADELGFARQTKNKLTIFVEENNKLTKEQTVITLGGHPWTILYTTSDKCGIIITKDIIGKLAFHNKSGNISWQNSHVRKYLNTAFLDIFSLQEKKRIIASKLENDHESTTDKVFLLSKDEAIKYFDTPESRVATYNTSPFWWWLRSPGKDLAHIATVNIKGSINNDGETSVYMGGGVYSSSGYIGCKVGGVRPVLKIIL